MKKIILLGLFFAIMVLSFIVYTVNGQTSDATESANTTISPTLSAAQILEKRVADKVSEIRKINNLAISGVVLSNKLSLIKIKTNNGTNYDVKLDDTLTKYFRITGATKKEIKSDDIVKDNYIIVTGVITDQTMTANSIFIDENFLVSSGKISNVDKENFSIKVVTSAKEEISLDIENSTKQAMLNIKTNEIEKSGFSKFKEGDTVNFVVKKGIDDQNKYVAYKILLIPQEYFLK